MGKQTDETDIESNLIDIRRYLETHARVSGPSARPPGATSAPAEDDERESFRYAEYGDGRRPRFSRTDLILIALLILLVGLVTVFVLY